MGGNLFSPFGSSVHSNKSVDQDFQGVLIKTITNINVNLVRNGRGCA